MTGKFNSIVFMQGTDAIDALDMLDVSGELATIDYLTLWDTGEVNDISDVSPWGNDDRVFTGLDGYILTYNLRLGYIGLCKKMAS